MWNDSQIVFLAIILPLFFAASLILEGLVKRRSGKEGRMELILGNIFLVLTVVAIILMTIAR